MKRRSNFRGKDGGFSLIELMVAAALAMIVAGVVASLYFSSRNIFRFQESYSRLQETGRFVLDVVGKDLRDSAYMGCGGMTQFTNILTTDDPTQVPYYWWLNNDQSVWAYEQATAMPLEFSGIRADSDAISINHRAIAGESMITAHDLPGQQFTISGNVVYPQGTVLVATDCQRTSIFRMSNSSATATSSIQYKSGVLQDGKDNIATVQLSPAQYSNGGFISPLVTNAYYVMDSNNPAFATNPCPSDDPNWVRPVLVVRTLAGSTNGVLKAPQPVACDVMTMQARFGVDNDGDLAADQWLKANEVGASKTAWVDKLAAWNNVVSMRVDFLVVNPKANTLPGNEASFCLDFNGGGDPAVCTSTSSAAYNYIWTSDSSNGRRNAKVFTSTFALRNRGS